MSSPYPAPTPINYDAHLAAQTPGVVSGAASPLVGQTSYTAAVDIKTPTSDTPAGQPEKSRMIWKILDTVLALLIFVSVILLWVYYPSWQTVVTGLFIIFFSVLMAICNWKPLPIARKYALFLFTPLGRGLAYFFIGSFVVVSTWWWLVLVGVICMCIAVLYIITAFVRIPHLEQGHLDDE